MHDTTAVTFECKPEHLTYLLGHMEAGKPLPVLTSPDLEEACRLAKEAGTHDYTIDGRHITITRRKLPTTPVQFTPKEPIEHAVDEAAENVLGITNCEATDCKCRAAAHRAKDIGMANALLAHHMLDAAMAKPRAEADADLREKLEAEHPVNRCTDFDKDPRDVARDDSECGGGR